jgi:sterol 3beta-glucosyltransferase
VRITLLTYGSHGDVQPFVALGAHLRRAGHQITLAAPAQFAPLAAAHELAFVGLPGDIAAISRTLAGQGGTHSWHLMRAIYREVVPVAQAALRLLRRACQDADLLVYSFLLTYGGHMLAQERGIPDIAAQLFPMFAPTVHWPGMLAPTASLGPLGNYATHVIASAIFRSSQWASYQWLRRRDPTIGPRHLPWPDLGGRTPLLGAFSPTLVPPPPDWAGRCTVIGAWQLDAPTFTPPPALAHFLASDPPPIFIGLGSMMPPDPAATTAMIIAAVQRTGQRAIIQRGWSGLAAGALPPNIIAVDQLAHAWLFPQMAGIIHHGGAGTTHAALASGVPSAVLPFGADQPFWAARVARLGVGPAPLPARDLSVEALAQQIRIMCEPAIRARAAQIGQRMRAETGLVIAQQMIETQEITHR